MAAVETNLFIDGYIRQIEQRVCKQIIPDVIKILCYKYYLSVAKKLWLFNPQATAGTNKRLCISADIDIEDITSVHIDDRSANYKHRMIDINTFKRSTDPMINKIEGGICCLSNIIFEKNKFIRGIQRKKSRNMDVIFECNKDCSAKLIYEYQETKGMS